MQRKTLMLVLMIAASVIALAIAALVVARTMRADTAASSPEGTQKQAQTGASAPADAAEIARSPEELVRYYFSCWNAKQTDAMNACRIEADAGWTYEDMQYEDSIELLACAEQPQETTDVTFDPAWYPNPAEVAYVLADYTIRYNDAGKAFYLRDSSDRAAYQFWLVKETPDGGWRIAMEGY